MNFPDIFRDRFDELSQPIRRSSRGGNTWLIRDRESSELLRLKVQPFPRKPDSRAMEILYRHGDDFPGLLPPREFGAMWRWSFQIYQHTEGEDLELYLCREKWHPDLCLEFIRQIHATLGSLHRLGIVHGDIKPSNILIVPEQSDGSRFLLTDFDTSIMLENGQESAPTNGYTLTYIAPEVLGSGLITKSADYWALGMTLFRWLLGSHPLHKHTDQQIRELISTTWRPPFPRIEDVRFRALIGGLLARDPTTRWGHEKIGRWLDNEAGIISDGLMCANESASDIPFIIVGSQVFSDRDLARALLNNWHLLNDQEECHSLGQWLRHQLGRNDLADRLQSLLENPALNNDIRLLSFCHELVPDLPPAWRGRDLSAESLIAAARAAQHGNAESLAWLQSLQDGTCFSFYNTQRDSRIAEMGRKLLSGWDSWQDSWSRMLQAGAPENSRPTEEEALPELVLALFDLTFRGKLQHDASQMFEPKDLLLRAPWFLHLGTDLQHMDEAQLLVLKHLDETSKLAEYSMDNFDGFTNPEIANPTEQVVILESQRRLISERFAIPPGAEVIRLYPGMSIKPSSPNAQPEVCEGISRIWNSFRHSQSNRNQAEVEALRNAAADGTPSLDIRLVRMTDTLLQREAPNRDEAYLAQVSWRFSDGLTGKLLVRIPGLFFSPIKMKTPRLPSHGSMLLVLTSDTRIQLQTRQSVFKRSRLTRPMDIVFSWRPALMQHQGTLQKNTTAFVGPDLSLRVVDKRLTTPEPKAVIKPKPKLKQAAGSIIKANHPPVWQQQLWLAYKHLPETQQNKIRSILCKTTQAYEGVSHVR